MSTNATEPTGRYSVKNEGLSLFEEGKFVGVSGVPPLQFQAWTLENAPTDITTPGKQCYILSNENTGLYLTTGARSNIWPQPQASDANAAAATSDKSDFVIFPLDATTTADRSAAWVFVLDGTSDDTGTFEGKIISPDGRYKFGLYHNGSATSLTPATAYMSPDSIENIQGTTWKLQLSLTEEKK